MKKIALSIVLLGVCSLMQAEEIEYTTYVKVVSSEPAYERVVEQEPYEECWDERVPVREYRGGGGGDTTAGAIIGGAAGGILGHQISKGSGKDVATIGGAILGTLVGSNIASQGAQGGYETTRYVTRRKCVTKYRSRTVNRSMGYKNIGYFKGRKIVKFSDRKLSRIPVTVTISY